MTYIDYMNQLWRSSDKVPMPASEIALYSLLVNLCNLQYWKMPVIGREENLEESDAVIISLGEMMDFDNTLGIVESLPEGKQALRTNKMSPWYIFDIDNINE